MDVRIAHLYPDLMSIYGDRGNVLALTQRARWRDITVEVRSYTAGMHFDAAWPDLFFFGGGQDQGQDIVGADLQKENGAAVRKGLEGGAAAFLVCGGYQLFGRFYRDRSGAELPGVGLFPLHTVAGERRMIGDVLLECELEPERRRTLAGFENHAGHTILDPGAEPLGRVVAGFGNDGRSGFEGCRVRRAVGTYLHGPLLPRNPWLADWLLGQALGHASGGEAVELEPLSDALEAEAHAVSASRARSRGGRY